MFNSTASRNDLNNFIRNNPNNNNKGNGSNKSDGDGSGDGSVSRAPFERTLHVLEATLQKPSIPEVYPQVLALPIARRPLFPGFYKAVVIKDPHVTAAVKELMKEIANYADKGITPQELEFTQHSMIEREALRYETNEQKALYLERIAEYNLKQD